MICNKCEGKTVVRGLKLTKCVVCGLEEMINFSHSPVCKSCSDQYNICQYCGENFPRQVEYVEINKQGE